MKLNEAVNLRVGDKVIFAPSYKAKQYSFQSSLVEGQGETLLPEHEYFVSFIDFLDKKDRSFLRSVTFLDMPTPEMKEAIADVIVRVDNVRTPILYNHFKLPSRFSNSCIGEQVKESVAYICAEIDNFADLYKSDFLPPEMVLPLFNFTNNLGDCTLDDYVKYLDYAIRAFQPVSFEKFQEDYYDGSDDLAIGEEYSQFREAAIPRHERVSLDNQFVKFMISKGAKTQYEMMDMLSNGGPVRNDEILAFYEAGILQKEEWVAAACLGYHDLYSIIISEEREL